VELVNSNISDPNGLTFLCQSFKQSAVPDLTLLFYQKGIVTLHYYMLSSQELGAVGKGTLAHILYNLFIHCEVNCPTNVTGKLEDNINILLRYK
jgi:hypothetical protein